MKNGWDFSKTFDWCTVILCCGSGREVWGARWRGRHNQARGRKRRGENKLHTEKWRVAIRSCTLNVIVNCIWRYLFGVRVAKEEG
jgi:hypothetical protein